MKNKNCEGGYRFKCKACDREYQAEWRKQGYNADKKRNIDLKHRYGITSADYDRMYEEQGGKCLICHRPEEVLRVDHNHKTKEVRGLLCNHCNTGLGLFGDSIGTLQDAVEYLIERGSSNDSVR